MNVLEDSIFALKPALVLLEFSANEFLMGKDTSEVREKMETLIESILVYGSRIVLISFVDEKTIHNPPRNHPLLDKKDLALQYLTMLKNLSYKYSLLLIKDCFNGIFYNKEFMSDDIHPNNDGYARMAENISEAMYYTLKKNDMLR